MKWRMEEMGVETEAVRETAVVTVVVDGVAARKVVDSMEGGEAVVAKVVAAPVEEATDKVAMEMVAAAKVAASSEEVSMVVVGMVGQTAAVGTGMAQNDTRPRPC